MDGNTVHFIAGAAGGTAGAVLTCPLEVLKTRLQSSKKSLLTDRRLPLHDIPQHVGRNPLVPSSMRLNEMIGRFFVTSGPASAIVAERADYTTTMARPRLGIIACLRNIVVNEGSGALFKGLIPNLVGVAPSRAIYFAAYAHGKSQLNGSNLFNPDTPIIHLFAAAFAGFSSATCTNPIWVIKTRMQLNSNSLSTMQCTRSIYAEGGLKAFYKGVTASYYGLAETVIHLVIYEEIKRFLASNRNANTIQKDAGTEEVVSGKETKSVGVLRWFFEYMGAGAVSKTIATVVAYPHEVARTRLREENAVHKKFWQALSHVYKEEGIRGVYRGLGVQLVRQIPNTAVVMATYEAVVYLLSSSPTASSDEDYER